MNDTATATAAPPKCDANSTGRAAGEWGMTALPCLATRGLRSFRDATGTLRYFCPARGHAANAIRRFGRQETEAVRVERAIERITAEFDAYMGEDDENGHEGDPEFNGSFRS